ncbi:MAG: ABC transporter permease [Anaerolineae bacterium]|nr:ABC transporter permease [Anaerolineae bacterium]
MRLIFEKRESVSGAAAVLVPVASFLLSLLCGAILLWACGADPFVTYRAMAGGAFGSAFSLTETLVKAIPLMLTGLGVALAFRLRFWNIGAEGQLVCGGVAAAWVGLFWADVVPPWALLPACLAVGMAAGALWAGVPAFLKAHLRVDETLTTLMLNYVAILFSEHLYYGAWRDPKGYGFPGTAPLPEAAWLPRLAGRAHAGLILGVLAAAALWFIFRRTRWGFELRIIGENPVAARYLGINIARNVVGALLLSGALSGLAGACEVTAISHRLQQGLAIGYGYTAIIVAWMAQLSPVGVVFVALLMAALLVGGDQVQITMRLPAAVGPVLQGLILFPLLAGSLFTEYRLRLVRARGRPVPLTPTREVAP